jgi:peptidoglycan/xylan/chitin deacetylase (PgdA/CDA1 family)
MPERVAIPILMYHQIDTRPARGTPYRGLIVSPQAFARQMGLLKILGYKGLSMGALMPYVKGEKQGKVCGITFDDGYINNLEHALPILQKHQFSSTCYFVSAQLGGSNAWDHAKGISAQPLMDAQQMRVWHACGQEVGAHTCNHVDLTTLEPTLAREEIVGCKLALQDALGSSVQHFCYPYGRYNAEHVAMLQVAGYESATTTVRARAGLQNPPLELPRVQVMGAVWLPQFWRKIATDYEDRRGG